MERKILFIDEEAGGRSNTFRLLRERGYQVSLAASPALAEEEVRHGDFDAVVLGVTRNDGSAAALIKALRRRDSSLPIIVLTGSDQIEIAVAAVRCGADNVLSRPVEAAALADALDQLTTAPGLLARREPRTEEDFLGSGLAVRRLLEQAAQAAAGKAPVLITGETGTGKGLLAHWIHRNGRRASHPFARANCSGLSGAVLSAELFGSAPDGSAPRRQQGLLERAGHGTLLLDEVGDMEPGVQRRLLAALQPPLPDSCRPETGPGSGAFLLVSTTNHDLEALAQQGAFLPELLERLSATVLHIPPLRERLDEVPGLVRRILDRLAGPRCGITGETLRFLESYSWPGNLRELRNALEQAVLLAQGETLQPAHFRCLHAGSPSRTRRPPLTLSELKERHFVAVLQDSGGDLNQVAGTLGISRATTYRKLKELRGDRR